MMIGEAHRHNPTVTTPPWPLVIDDPTAEIYSPLGSSSSMGSPDGNMLEALTALHRYLPSNQPDLEFDTDPELSVPDSPVDAYTCDHFRMYDFKIRRCGRGRSHDWTECPYAHPGEKARRRDPRKFNYSGTACPDFRKGSCRKGDGCEFAHGVFECWLHPTRYRTQPCKDGGNCRRRVCFFAHSPDQMRVLPPDNGSFDGTMLRSCARSLTFAPSSLLSGSVGSGSVNDVVASLRKLQFNKVKSLPSSSWNDNNEQVRCYSSGLGSPGGSLMGPGVQSLPSTPTRPGIGYLDIWNERGVEGEPVEAEMERVESGRKLRAKMYEKLSKENCMDRMEAEPYMDMGSGDGPDVGWVSDLVDPN